MKRTIQDLLCLNTFINISMLSVLILLLNNQYSIVWIYHNLFTQSPVDGLFGWFPFLVATMNKTSKRLPWRSGGCTLCLRRRRHRLILCQATKISQAKWCGQKNEKLKKPTKLQDCVLWKTNSELIFLHKGFNRCCWDQYSWEMTGRIGWKEKLNTAETGLALQSCPLCISFLAAEEITLKPSGLKQPQSFIICQNLEFGSSLPM